MPNVKFKKCQECGSKMVIKVARKYKSKFWACSGYPDCENTSPFYGDGARAGIDIDIREIRNGFIITTTEKYPATEGDDEAIESYCLGEADLRVALNDIFDSAVNDLINKIKSCENFDEEPDPKEAKKRVSRARGERDIKKLIAKMNKTKERVAQEEV